MSKILEIIQLIGGDFKTWLFRVGAVLLLIFFLVVALGGVSQNDRWKIDHVEVSGAQAVSDTAILDLTRSLLVGNYYFTYARENSYLFPRFEISKRLLETFPRLKSVYASRVDNHTIRVEVTERSPFALWCGGSYSSEKQALRDCWFIDDTGFIFDHAPVFSDGVYLEVYAALDGKKDDTVLGAHIPEPRFSLAYSVNEGIKKSLGDTLRVIIKPEGEYGIVMKSSTTYPLLSGTEIRFKDNVSPEKFIKNLLAALEVQFPGVQSADSESISAKMLYYIDMRFGNKIFFGFEPERTIPISE